MGIDAEMYFTSEKNLSPKEILKLAVALGETFGANHFCRDGWDPKSDAKEE